MKILDRVTKRHAHRDPDDTTETGAERAERYKRRKEARAKLAEAERLQAEKAILDERVRFLDQLWQAAIEEHDRTVKPLQAELGELEKAAVERIRQRKPTDSKAETRRVELLREIADANATLESHRPEPPAGNWGVGPGGFTSVGSPAPRSERDRLAAKSNDLQHEIVRLMAAGSKLTNPGIGDPFKVAEIATNSRLSRMLDGLRNESRKLLDHRPTDLGKYSDHAVLQFKRSKREASAMLATVNRIMNELEERVAVLLKEMEGETE